MFRIDVDAVCQMMREVARDHLLPRFRNLHAHEIHFKGEDNPYTIADLEAEKDLSERLKAFLPGSVIVGEEDHACHPDILRVFQEEKPVWIVDPLDGTKAFISGEPVYGMIVALAHRNKTLFAWLYDPSSDEFIVAESGGGAWYKGRRLSLPVPVCELKALSGAFGARIMARLPEVIGKEGMGPRLCRVLSSCHDYARLVLHEPHFSCPAPIHFYGTYCTCTPWDNAAGILIHQEAGGYSAHWDGRPFVASDYACGMLTAPNREIWELIKRWLSPYCCFDDSMPNS